MRIDERVNEGHPCKYRLRVIRNRSASPHERHDFQLISCLELSRRVLGAGDDFSVAFDRDMFDANLQLL